jgi:hypothetical protein
LGFENYNVPPPGLEPGLSHIKSMGFYQLNYGGICGGGGIRTHSAEARNLQFRPTLPRWRTTIFTSIVVPRTGFEPVHRDYNSMCFPLLYPLSYRGNRCVYSLHYLPQLLIYLTNVFPVIMPVRPFHLLTLFWLPMLLLHSNFSHVFQ